MKELKELIVVSRDSNGNPLTVQYGIGYAHVSIGDIVHFKPADAQNWKYALVTSMDETKDSFGKTRLLDIYLDNGEERVSLNSDFGSTALVCVVSKTHIVGQLNHLHSLLYRISEHLAKALDLSK